MDFPPIVLLPCRIMLWVSGFLVPATSREEWKNEWFVELWYRWLALDVEDVSAQARISHLYRVCAGCFRDAWWHFSQSGEAHLRFIESLRSPRFCLCSLTTLLLALVVVTGFLPATRHVVFPLPYADPGSIAVISRTGRMEAIREGIPENLTWQWRKESHLIRSVSACSFPKSMHVAALGSTRSELGVTVSPNIFATLRVELGLPTEGHVLPRNGIWLSESFWHNQLHSARHLTGEHIEVDGRDRVIRGILPAGFWLLSPAISFYEVDESVARRESMLVVRSNPGVTVKAIENELYRTADRNGYEFANTAPHVMFLSEAVSTPLWLFVAAMVVAVILVILAHGSRWLNSRETESRSPGVHWRWWSFFFVKTAMGLLFVFLSGIELFVGHNQLAVSEALGGPVLIWFYILGCTLALLSSISDQHARCRVCQRLLGFPIRIGCPGCLFLDWAGTEFLCPQGHGVLYVPHHITCWEEADRWVLLEA